MKRTAGILGGLALTIALASCAGRRPVVSPVPTEDFEELAYAASMDAADAHLRLGELTQAWVRLREALESRRGWEYHHLLTRADQSISTWSPNAGTIASVKSIPGDANTVLVGTGAGTLERWNVGTGTRIASHTALKGAVYEVSLSPDGTHAIVWWNSQREGWSGNLAPLPASLPVRSGASRET